MRTVDGRLLLGDWDHVAVAPRMGPDPGAVLRRRFQHPPAARVGDLAQRYGWDIRSWPHADDLIAVRELHGLAPYIRNAVTKAARAEELAHRLRTLRDDDGAARWHASA